jgi:hypothetical protein
MPRKPLAFALFLFLLLAGGALWPMGQKMDLFVPVDALIEQKRYSEAMDMLQGLLVSAPRRTSAIKERIAKVLLLQADDNIAAQRYNEALSELSAFWTQYPERADQAQQRIRKINQVRKEYNKKADSLLAFMSDAKNRSDPNYNLETTKRLQELDDLDRNNPDSKKTITSLKETSLALVNQDSMKAVMSSGRALIDKGSYPEAAREYLKGFPLFKPEFDNAGYDDITLQAVAKMVQRAQSMPDSFDGIQGSLAQAVDALSKAFASGQPDVILANLPASQRSLAELQSLRESVFSTGADFAKSFETIPKEGKSPIEYQYLAYLDLFLRGRPDSFGEDKKPQAEKGLPEGIGGALLAQTDSLLGILQKAVESSVDSAYTEAEKDFDAGSYPEAKAAFLRAAAIVEPGLQVLANWSGISEEDFVPDLVDLKADIARGAQAAARLAQSASLAQAGSRLAGLAADCTKAVADYTQYMGGLESETKASAPGIPLDDARKALDGYRSAIRGTEAALAIENKGLPALEASAGTATASYSERLKKTMANAQAAEFTVATARAGVEADYIGRELVERGAALDAADAQIEGEVSALPERSRAGYRDPSPTSASRALEAEGPKLEALASWIDGDLASMAKEEPDLVADASFAAARARIVDLREKAGQLQVHRSSALAKALEKRKSAESALLEARTDMTAARASLADAKSLISQDKKGAKSTAIQKDFSESRDRLEKSLGGIVESSNADFDIKTWNDFQDLYASVSSDIDQTKKDYIINETFRLLSEGQTYYEQALFDLAGDSLNSAQELWHEDNDTDQEQVKYWQNLVRQASDTNNKREVKQDDALYYDISSYLSEARKRFQEGDRLMKSGRKDDATAAFESARQNISFVTRAFPLNAEAGFLTLQILKATDPNAYRMSLPRRIQEAVDLMATDATSGYSRIADLYKMEPNYPGLRAILEKAEIKVGKRRAPPSQEDLANAASFVAQAETLLKSGRKDDATKAESDLNSALTYDPSNRRALAMLRDLKTLQGKTAGPSLGLADQAILDQAMRSFASSQYNQARDQLSQLLADPNKRTRDVLKLDNDLKALGYD